MILTYLKSFTNSSLLCGLVEQIILDRIGYHENCEYDETHQQLLFEIGVCIAKFKGWKEAQIIKKCLHTPLEPIFKGFESILGKEEEPKKQKALSKKEQIMMKIKQKQEAFKKEHGIQDDEDDKTTENIDYDNICIICMCDENSEESPLGRMVYLHENNADQLSKYQETHGEELYGSYENGIWKKPYANEHGCWKWEPCQGKTTNIEDDANAGKLLNCCQHKVHYDCFIYQQQNDADNKFQHLPFLQGLAACPLCSSFSTHFVPTQKPIEIEIKEKSIENIEEVSQFLLSEIMKSTKQQQLTEVEKYSIKHTIGESLTEEESIIPINQYLHLTQIINTTISSYEIQMREQQQTQFEHISPVLNSYLSMCIKLASSFEMNQRLELLQQLLQMKPKKNPFLHLIRIFCLLPHCWNEIVTISHLREFIAIETEIFEHSTKSISLPIGNCEKKEILSQYETFKTENELLLSLSQIYLRKIHLLQQIITLQFEQLKDHYDYPIEVLMKYHLSHQSTCLPSLIRPTLPQQFKLITLPKTHQELLSQTMKMKCCECFKEGSEILEHCGICLHCGVMVCMNILKESNTKTHSLTSAIDHIHKCSGKSGLILAIHKSIIVFITGDKFSVIMKQLYTNELGDYPSSNNLYSKMDYVLNEDWYNKLRKEYLNGELITKHNYQLGMNLNI